MNAKVDRFWQNVPSSPDLPTVTRAAADLYQQTTGDAIDGVLVVDPVALERAARDHRTRVGARARGAPRLGRRRRPVAPRPVPRLPGARGARQLPCPTPLTPPSIGSPKARSRDRRRSPTSSARRSRVGTSSSGRSIPAAQPLLAEVGLDGTLPPTDDQDVLAVAHANTQPNKLDAYLHEDLDYDVEVDEETGRGGGRAHRHLHERRAAGVCPATCPATSPGSLRHQPVPPVGVDALPSRPTPPSMANPWGSNATWSSAATATSAVIEVGRRRDGHLHGAPRRRPDGGALPARRGAATPRRAEPVDGRGPRPVRAKGRKWHEHHRDRRLRRPAFTKMARTLLARCGRLPAALVASQPLLSRTAVPCSEALFARLRFSWRSWPLSVVSAAPASAGEDPYPPPEDAPSRSTPTNPTAGDDITVTGENWDAGRHRGDLRRRHRGRASRPSTLTAPDLRVHHPGDLRVRHLRRSRRRL